MAPTFSSHLAIQIEKPSKMLPSPGGRAPIVISELDFETESGEERDDLEELNDFTSLLMPAARKSAARRLGALNSPIGRRVQDGQRQRHSQRNSVPASKFPVIDEDLLMLATRKIPADGCSAIPPPNLCRLITNVSEARWTTKRPLEHAKAMLEQRAQKERPKSVGHLPIPRGIPHGQVQEAQNILRKKRPDFCRANNGQGNGTNKQTKRNDEAALRRMSALSVVSSYTANMEEAANCDCTSLAMAAFRPNWVAAMRRKKWQQTKQQTRERQADDAYRKASPPPIPTRDSCANDSGISSSSCCSSESSRSASLADAVQHQCRLLNPPNPQTPSSNCSRCGLSMNLPPKSVPNEKKRIANQNLQQRRRHWLTYLLGNMLRMIEKEKPDVGPRGRQSRGGGTTVDLKLMGGPNAGQTGNGRMNVPRINVQMAEEEGEGEDEAKASEEIPKGKGKRRGRSGEGGGDEAVKAVIGKRFSGKCVTESEFLGKGTTSMII